jgi:hypothetical protein
VKLTDLSPRFFDVPGAGGARDGVSFLCPCCRRVRLAIQFTPMGDDEIHAKSHREDDPHTIVPLSGNVWQRTGEDFETLTLSPSVDASAAGHWHGWVQNGDCR